MKHAIYFVLLFFICPTAFGDPNCPDGYASYDLKFCYKIYSDLRTRTSAADQCKSDGGYLASINNAFTNSYIYSLATSQSLPVIYFGVFCSNMQDADSCSNDDGTYCGYDNSAEDGTYDGTHGQCQAMYTSGIYAQQWTKNNCTIPLGFVCEVRYKNAPIVYACPPYHARYGNKCYQVGVGSGRQSGNQLRDYCRKFPGGNLAIIDSSGLNDFLKKDLKTVKNQMATFGLRCNPVQSKGDRSWCEWDDGTPFHYNNFKSGYPRQGYGGCCDWNNSEWLNCYDCNDEIFEAQICQFSLYPT